MRMGRHIYSAFVLALAWALSLSFSTASQAQSVLLADRLDLSANGALQASGNVQILFGSAQLTAQTIQYEPAGGLTITGPIILTLEDGTTTIFAAAADLDADLRNGVLQSARMVLDAQMQLAASQIRRVDGRYTELRNTVASSCQICEHDPTPLWQIRAKSIIHDQEKQRLFFERARFEFRGVPIVELPRISLPDPTARRANGFLVPKLSNSDTLGLKLEIPYFVTLGDHADLTIAPLLSAETRSLKLRYRRAFRKGNIELNGAISDDSLARPARAYLFAEGQFALPRDFTLRFDIETTSDTSYLAEYGLSSKNRLDSQIAVERIRNDQLAFAEVTIFETLRGRELAFADELPSVLGEARLEQYVDMSSTTIGGLASWHVGALSRWRSSSANVNGRDYLGLSAGANWGRTLITDNGIELRAGLGAELRADFVAQDSNFAPSTTQFVPHAELELRYPLVKSSPNGAFHTVTPIVHLAWSERYGSAPPFEDGLLAELDPGNLFALNRMPGRDDVELGARIGAGLTWQRIGARGVTSRLVAGRIWRDEPAPQFTPVSGLSGLASDWVLGAELDVAGRVGLASSLLLDTGFSPRKADTRVFYSGDALGLAATHSWTVADPASNRTNALSQLLLDGSYDFANNWTGQGNLTYDFQARRPIEAGLGMEFANECLQVNFSLSRRFTGSGNILQNTDIGFEFAVLGFGTGSTAKAARSCVK